MMQRLVIGLALLLAACGGDDEVADSETTDSNAGGEEVAAADEPPEAAAPAEESPYLAVGTEAPDFSAPDQASITRQLSALRGNVVVLYFYPRDDTPGCTAEACAFRDAWERYEDAGVTVLGVSVDSVESHLAFAERHSLPFSLIADVDASISAAYGVRRQADEVVFANRVTYVIAADGTIAHVFEEVDPGVHADEVLRVIAGL